MGDYFITTYLHIYFVYELVQSVLYFNFISQQYIFSKLTIDLYCAFKKKSELYTISKQALNMRAINAQAETE